MFKPVLPVSSGAFVSGVRTNGATMLRLFSEKEVVEITRAIEHYPFSPRPEYYGRRNVIQHFEACEEGDIPQKSVVRLISKNLVHALCDVIDEVEYNTIFPLPLNLNDHLLLRYPPGAVGLSAHRDTSRYKNLIVSVTLSGRSRFNIHETPNGTPNRSFLATPGMVVFMAAPGFCEENQRPFHSITDVDGVRTSLILKQKGV